MTKPKPPELAHRPDCKCDHKLQSTGAVFFQSTGWILCVKCNGVQPIRKPIED